MSDIILELGLGLDVAPDQRHHHHRAMSYNDVLGLDIVLPTNLDMRQHHRHHRAMSHGSQRSREEPPTDKQDKGHIESRRSSGGSRRGHRRTRAVDFVDLSMLRLSIVPDGPESDARDDAEVEGEGEPRFEIWEACIRFRSKILSANFSYPHLHFSLLSFPIPPTS